MSFDAIVIGSGFGGAITACRLQQRGLRVLVLERGRRWDKGSFPRKAEDPWIWSNHARERSNGWMELRRFKHMSVVAGAAVGGGSLIYANVSCEAHPTRFERGWPQEITYAELKPHYDTVGRVMNVRPVPDGQVTERMRLMQRGAQKLGMGDKYRKLDLAVSFDDDWTPKRLAEGLAASKPFVNEHGAEQGTCVHLGTCDIGCDARAKNTLDRNYLFLAEKAGAQVRPLCFVTNIAPTNDRRYRVSYEEIVDGHRVARSEQAKRVIVAAGSMGSTELLLRCKLIAKTLPNISDTLGKGWSSNGDFLTPALYLTRKPEPSVGPTIGSVIDTFDPDTDGGFWIEDGGFPNLATAWLDRARAARSTSLVAKAMLAMMQKLLRQGDAFSNVMPWFAQGIDAANGTLKLIKAESGDDGRSLDLEWDVARSEAVIDKIVATHKALSWKTGGVPLVPPSWSVFKDLITPHPLGGCNMADDRAQGVVNHRGQVFGYPGLYVVDGAIIPEALGVNPSRTIGALAELLAQRMSEE